MSKGQTLNLENMKKTILIILAISLTAAVFAQGRGRGQKNCQPQRSDIKQEIKGELIKQQKDFYTILSQKDMAKVEELKSEMTKLRAELKEQNGVEQSRELHDKMFKIKKQAEKIADKYPEQSKKYTNEISNIRSEFREGKSNYGRGNGRGMKANKPGKGNYSGGREYINDPAFILLFNPDNNAVSYRGQGRKAGRGGKGSQGAMRRGQKQGDCNYGRAGGHNGQGFGRAQNLPDGLKKELQAYAEKNIWPVLVEKRKDFDKNLSESEKNDIASARAMLKTRNAMVKQWRESDDFVPGQRRNDTTFDGFREQMQENMMKIRDIAGMHYADLKSVEESIADQKVQWKSDMKKIFEENNFDKPSGNKGRKGGFNMNNQRWAAFLLLDTEKPGDNLLFYLR